MLDDNSLNKFLILKGLNASTFTCLASMKVLLIFNCDLLQDAVIGEYSMVNATSGVSNGRKGRELVWSWLLKNWDDLGKKVNLAYRGLILQVHPRMAIYFHRI